MRDQRALHARIEPDRAGDAAAARMVHRDVGPAQDVGNARFGGGRGGNAGEGADLDDPFFERERPGDSPQDSIGDLVGAAHFVSRRAPGDCEFVAAQSADHRVRAELVSQRDRDSVFSKRSPVS